MKKRKHLLLGLGSVFLLAGLAYGAYWFFFARYSAVTDDAYVSGSLVQLTPQVNGNVVSILADDTAKVNAGQPLVILDDRDAKIAIEKAEAELAAVVRNTKKLYQTEDELTAQIKTKELELERARTDWQRRKNLEAEHAVSSEELQHAEKALAIAAASLEDARHQLQGAKALVGKKIITLDPSVMKAETSVRDAYLGREHLVIRAPQSGYVARRSVQIGQRVSPGMQLMIIVPLDDIWIDANFKEDQLKNIRIGQSVTLSSDLYGKSISFSGKVAGIGTGTGSVFSLLPPQNASGNWIKVVQRVPVRISLDSGQLQAHPLRLGLSLTAKIDTHDRSGKMLATGSDRHYRTAVFEQDSQLAEERIKTILRDNE